MQKSAKFTFGIMILLLFCGLYFSACSSAPPPPPPRTTSSGSSSLRPGWINSPYSVFDEKQYVVITGSGITAEEAEFKAIANLVGFFRISIDDNSMLSNVYDETTKDGKTSSTERTTSERFISTNASIDKLVGAEVRERWNNGKEYYAAAFMDRAKAVSTYTSMINDNQALIANLINMTTAQKNTLQGFARYQFAALVADVNDSYVSVLQAVGGAVPSGLEKGDKYRIDAKNIAREVPIRVNMTKGKELDNENRIQNAFTKAIGNAGFRAGTANSPYTLETTLALSEVQSPNQNKFVRYEISARLIDSRGQEQIPTYSINGREGHLNFSEAQQRAVRAAEAKINEEFTKLLDVKLSLMY